MPIGRVKLIATKENVATPIPLKEGGRIKMEMGRRYVFKAAPEDEASRNFTVERIGKDLQVFLDGGDKPDLILEDYFAPGMTAQLYGTDENGSVRAYAPDDAGTFHGHLMLGDGERTPVALTGPVVSDSAAAKDALSDSAGWVVWPLVAGASVLGIHAIAKHSSGHSSGHSSTDADVSPQVAITQVVSDSRDFTGDLQPGARTQDTRPEIIGTGTVNAIIRIYDGNILLGSTTVQADGTWSFIPAKALQQNSQSVIHEDLTETPHSITAVASDGAGHTSMPTGAFVFTVLTGMPTYPGPGATLQVAISGLDNDQSPLQGDTQPGTSTHDTRPEIIGTGTANATINVYDGASLLGTTTVQVDGTWSFTPSEDLAVNTHSITATAQDAAGHVSQPTAAFVIDIFAGPIIEREYWPSSLSGPVPDGGTTTEAMPTLTGKTIADATVTLYDNEGELGSVTTAHDGTWSFTLKTQLNTGEHIFVARAEGPGSDPVHTYASYSLAVDHRVDHTMPDNDALELDVTTLQSGAIAPSDTDAERDNTSATSGVLKLALGEVLQHDDGGMPWFNDNAPLPPAAAAAMSAPLSGAVDALLQPQLNPDLLIP